LTLQADCPNSKAATTTETRDPEEFDIPDHETITRRKQFRMKAVQKEKRAERKKERELKKAEKEATKQAKAEAKEAKLAEKAAAKKGRKPKAASKSDTGKKDNEKKPKQVKETAVDETLMDAPVTPSPLPKDKSPLQTPVKHVKSRKLKKLRMLEAKLKEAKSPVKTVVACHEEDFENQEVAQESSKVSKKTKRKAVKKTQNNDPGATHECSKGSNSHEDCAVRGKKRKAGKTKMPNEKETAPKKSKKSSEAPAPKAAPKRKKANEEQPDEEIKAQVEQVLHECREGGCTHKTFPKLEFCKATYEFSTYWSRKAVGVKVNKQYLPDKASKPGKKSKNVSKAQVAYFASRTSCTYSNLLLAQLYVS